MRIGIFGGTFDPIHFGHIHAIAYSIEEAELDLIHIMVAGDPYQKADVQIGSSKRLEWVRKSINEFFPENDQVVVDDREVKRQGPTYTIDSVVEIQNEHPSDEIVLIVGEDIPTTISEWKDSEKLLELVELFIVPRSIFPTSSTYIRECISAGKAITGLLPNFIEAEIVENSLYN